MPFEAVEINELAEDIVLHLKIAAEKKGNRAFIGRRACCLSVEWRQVLYEMFYNITDNAIRYTDEAGKVLVFAGQNGKHPCYYVEDRNSVFQRMNRNVFLSVFTGWIKAIRGRLEEPDWDFLL